MSLKNTMPHYILQSLLLLAILGVLNVIGQYINISIDLTEDNRYSISESTSRLLAEVDDIIYIEVFLDGEFPAGIKRLQTATRDLLYTMDKETGGLIEFEFKDPLKGSPSEVESLRNILAEKGLAPVRLILPDQDAYAEKLIYPYAVVHYSHRTQVVNLMEADVPGVDREIILHNSASLLEYKMTTAINRVRSVSKPKIVLSEGYGEASRQSTTDLETELRRFFDTGRINLDSVTEISPKIDVLFVVRPTRKFTDRAKFIIDQYVLSGGNVIFLIDKINASLDSLPSTISYVPQAIDPGLDDLLFKYGVRVKSNLVLDLECSGIPLVTGMQGGKPQYALKPWLYHPLLSSKNNHPVVANLNRVDFQFASSIDTIRTKSNIKKTILLSSSNSSRTQTYPMRLGFEAMRLGADPSKFDKKEIPMAVLLEGKFSSLYENRVSNNMKAMLTKLGRPFTPIGEPSKVCVISDGQVAMNGTRANKISPLGYNIYDRQTYGNKDFLMNLVEYMIDDKNIQSSRSKKIKIRLLDNEETQKATKWRIINIVIPLVLLLFFGFVFNYLRKKRFAG